MTMREGRKRWGIASIMGEDTRWRIATLLEYFGEMLGGIGFNLYLCRGMSE